MTQIENKLEVSPGALPAGEKVGVATRLAQAIFPTLLFVAGFVAVFFPVVTSGFRNVAGNQGDTRWIFYMFEHYWRWICSASGHENFWNVPFFYPMENVVSYSHSMFSFAPFYWIWRIAGFDMTMSYQLWIITMLALNYAISYLIIRRLAGVGPVFAAFGAYIITYGASRMHQLDHTQMLPMIYVLGAIGALWRYFQLLARQEVCPIWRRIWIFVFFACVTAQFWGDFYNAYFLFLIVAVTIVILLATLVVRAIIAARAKRQLVIGPFWRDWWVILICAIATAGVTAYLASHYLAAARSAGLRNFYDVCAGLPRITSWIYVTSRDPFYSWMAGLDAFKRIYMNHEQPVGAGFLTTALSIYGLIMMRGQAAIRVLCGVTLAMMVLVTVIPRYWTFWYYIYHWLPGAAAMRVVCRIGVLMLIPYGIGLAGATQALRDKKKIGMAMVLGLACCAEQFVLIPYEDSDAFNARVTALVSRIDKSKKAFAVSSTVPRNGIPLNLDAMLAGMETGVPTVNGCSGSYPWDSDAAKAAANPLAVMESKTPQEQAAYRAALNEWLARWKVNPDDVQLIEFDYHDGPADRGKLR